MNNYCVYIHTNIVNNKKYVGQTCQIPPHYRWGGNGQGYKNGNSHFWSAIQKYGWNNFTHEIIKTNLSLEEANELEKELIKKYHTNNNKYGYNSQLGGNNKTPNKLSRILMSKSALNRSPVSIETKNKLSHINKNRKKKEETKLKMSQSAINREKYKKENNIKKQRKVRCINNGKEFNSIKEAANWCGLTGTSGISLVCNNKKQKTAGVHPITREKLKWEYVDENQ